MFHLWGAGTCRLLLLLHFPPFNDITVELRNLKFIQRPGFLLDEFLVPKPSTASHRLCRITYESTDFESFRSQNRPQPPTGFAESSMNPQISKVSGPRTVHSLPPAVQNQVWIHRFRKFPVPEPSTASHRLCRITYDSDFEVSGPRTVHSLPPAVQSHVWLHRFRKFEQPCSSPVPSRQISKGMLITIFTPSLVKGLASDYPPVTICVSSSKSLLLSESPSLTDTFSSLLLAHGGTNDNWVTRQNNSL
jgi:hypothetical protein